MTEIKLYKSKKKAFKLFLIALPFIIGGVWFITRSESSESQIMTGWITTCFFGLAIPVSLFHLFDNRPQIIVNETGIFFRATHNEFINWEVIKDAYPININGQHFICLSVLESFKPSKNRNKFYRSIAKLNKAIGAQELNIHLGQLDVDTMKVTEFIITMSQAEKSKKAELIKNMAKHYV